MLKNFTEKKIVFIILMIIVLFQLGISVYYGSKKSSLFIDEVLSYTLANRLEGGFLELPQEEWLNEEWYIDNLSVNDEERFDYSIPYKNQIEDVHPPLFYFLFHTSSSFFPGKITYWIGLGWNVLFFLGCSVLLYFIGKKLFKNEKCALLGVLLYSVSFGGLNTMTFIRMYMLMTFLLLSHVYVYVKFMDSEQIPLKAYFFLGLTLTLGVLTQYYFLIAAFFWGAGYTLKFLTRKRWKELFRHWGTIVLSGCVSLVVFPAMLKHIFLGGRGVEARNNFISSENYLVKLKSMFTILDSQMFYGILFALISVLIILIVVGRIGGGRASKDGNFWRHVQDIFCWSQRSPLIRPIDI